jgi:hypothetical protein
MSDLMLSGTAYAFAEWGIWKAKCPRPGCTNAMALEVDQPVFVCLGLHSCGIETPIAWPADPDAVEALLAMRPLAINRNWLPNESLEDLLAENALATTASGYFAATGTNTLAQRTATGTFVGTDEATSSTSYTNLTTAGPAVTVTSGVATLVCIGAWITNATGGARSLMSYAISGATTQAAQDITSASAQLTTTSSSCYFGSCRTYLLGGQTAGTSRRATTTPATTRSPRGG